MKFYTADTHWDHANIIKLCNRPFKSIQEMQEVMINNWNARVGVSDDVYILGDFSFGATIFYEYATKLNGVKHFIVGNHDHEAYKKAQVMTSNTKGIKNIFFHGDIWSVKDDNVRVVLCHYPIYEWEGSFKGAIHFHGHCHGNIGKSFKTNAYDVGVDVWNFTPVTLKEILNGKIDSRKS